MMKKAGIVVSLLMLGLASPANAAEPAGRPPTGGWVVEFDEAQCVASRNYGTDDDPLILALKAPAAGNVMQMLIIRNGRGGRYAEQVEGAIGVDSAKHEPISLIAMMTGEGRRRLYRLNIPLDRFATISEASTLSLYAGTEFRERFQLSGITPLLKVMNECVADLKEAWNISPTLEDSPEAQVELGGVAPIFRVAMGTLAVPAEPPAPSADMASGPRRAVGDLAGLIRSNDYPALALRDGTGGAVKFLLLIDETGKVADCTVTETSGIAILDAQSCALIMARAKFEPAIDENGNPTRDFYHQRIRWRVAR